MALVRFGKLLLLVGAFCISASAELFASTDSSPPATTSFAYSISHAVTPLSDAVLDQIADQDGNPLDAFDESEGSDVSHDEPVDVRVGPPRALSQNGLCSAVVSVARANNLPIPFFANLIWQESNFDTNSISRAGAQGIAQFMPKTAVEFGLINPFEPIHALNVAGKFVRELYEQFGNLGLAAAAYNAGPRRVINWMAKRGELPGETRNYVLRITGHPAEAWTSPQAKTDPEAALMPAKAPCVEVAEAVKAQAEVVRVSKLMVELAQAATAPARDNRDVSKPGDAASKVAHAKPGDTDSQVANAKPDRKTRAAARMVKAALAGARKQESRRASAKNASKNTSKNTSERIQDRGHGPSKAAIRSSRRHALKVAAKEMPNKAVVRPTSGGATPPCGAPSWRHPPAEIACARAKASPRSWRAAPRSPWARCRTRPSRPGRPGAAACPSP